jgi:hypothetical protein
LDLLSAGRPQEAGGVAVLHLLILAVIILAIIGRARHYWAVRQRMQAQARFYLQISDQLGRVADQLEAEERHHQH